MNTTLFKFVSACKHNKRTAERASNISRDVGRIVRDKRLKKGMTLDELSKPLGVSLVTVWNLEQGRKVWTAELAQKAFAVLEGKR